ncbi:antigen, P35 [Clostridium botulinum B str. Osaka05]|uniref:Antigen, P35 n=1 Tax=Clostridium botulinum B str. Osaka05 TaxID=1407017 RepID=A0A060N397_CLOBO|nr:hypothetical protein [Clostridium botulinum]BAO04956.1 antigen, P35 [Clostridium botulinum B str. Osaka05]
MININYVNFKFVASTRCLMVLDKEGILINNKFYGEFEENISSSVNNDIKQWLNKNTNVKSYSHNLHELEIVPDYHTIKVIFENNNSLTTRIRGTVKDIINHYKSNNFSIWCNNSKENKQVKKIDFLESPVLNNSKSYCYLFINNNGLFE